MRCSATVACLVTICLCDPRLSVAAFKAARKGRQREPAADRAAGERSSQSEYDRLLIQYLASIDDTVEIRRGNRVSDYKALLKRWRKADEDIAQRESEILNKLVAKARGDEIIFGSEGPCEESHLVIPTSAASARLFRALHAKKAVEGLVLVSLLGSHPQVLHQEWIPFLEGVATAAQKDSRLHKCAVKTLYRAGVSREKYRPDLLRMIRRDSHTPALDVLFFDIDEETGEASKVVTHGNLSLLKELGRRESPPEIRVTCAHYATEIRDYDLAQSICVDS